MNEEIKIKVKTTMGEMLEMFRSLTNEQKDEILKLYVFEDIIEAIEKQLKHDSDTWSAGSDGFKDGALIRKKILEIQGIEPEFKKDLEGRIRSLESSVCNYKKYYDWYFKLWHYLCDTNNTQFIGNSIGWL